MGGWPLLAAQQLNGHVACCVRHGAVLALRPCLSHDSLPGRCPRAQSVLSVSLHHSLSLSPWTPQQETASLLKRGAPSDCVERILRGLLRYVADAVMLQLMSGACGERVW